jgi:hypothetical protein
MIEILSFWRNDAERQLEARARHLLEKTSSSHEVEWHWVVGDSTDETLDFLCDTALFAGLENRVRIQIADTGIVGEDVPTRRRRGSVTASAAFAELSDEADFILLHESDLRSPPDVADRLLEAAGGRPCAAWPEIEFNGRRQFYDIWAYRDLRGRPFEFHPPFARGYTRGAPFRVSSFGSCWIVPADILRGRVIESRAVLELCEQWQAEGLELFADPRIKILQPVELWP